MSKAVSFSIPWMWRQAMQDHGSPLCRCLSHVAAFHEAGRPLVAMANPRNRAADNQVDFANQLRLRLDSRISVSTGAWQPSRNVATLSAVSEWVKK